MLHLGYPVTYFSYELVHSVARFEVILHKEEGSRIGIDVDHKDEQKLLVERIQDTGLVRDYNRKQTKKDMMVCDGDYIVSINGVKNSIEMYEIIA